MDLPHPNGYNLNWTARDTFVTINASLRFGDERLEHGGHLVILPRMGKTIQGSDLVNLASEVEPKERRLLQ